MKKLNNKGFAISTVIYGLSIMGILLVAIVMASMASTRSNSRQLAKSIEEELNRFSKTDTAFVVKNDEDTASRKNVPIAQEYIVPTAGWYKIELWGSKGLGEGSNGAYTSGLIELKEGEKIYFYVGKDGRETDVRVQPGDYNDEYSASTRIMVAAGGGSDNNAAGGTLLGYTSTMYSVGGYIDSAQGGTYGLFPPAISSTATSGNVYTNGTLIGEVRGYTVADTNTPPSVNANVKPTVTKHLGSTSGGGDGYYPSSTANQGGTSFIAGYGGCHPVIKGKVSSNPVVTVYDQKYDEESDSGVIEYGNTELGRYYFIDGMMLANVNNGEGYAKIERMVIKGENGSTLVKKNTKFDKNITYVTDCVDTSDINIVKNATIVSQGTDMFFKIDQRVKTTNTVCTKLLLKNASRDIDEITIFHKPGVDYKNEIIQVCDASSCEVLKNKSTATTLSETETLTGIRISAYQPDSMAPLPASGNYYILPVLSENKVVTAAKSAETNSDALTIQPLRGYKRQKWAIEKIEDTADPNPNNYNYRIYELARYGAFSIAEDENMFGNKIVADSVFNKYDKNEVQYWKIIPIGNGTYIIKTSVGAFDSTISTGHIGVQTNIQRISRNKGALEIARNNYDTTRFKLISVDYSSSN